MPFKNPPEESRMGLCWNIPEGVNEIKEWEEKEMSKEDKQKVDRTCEEVNNG